MGKSEANRQGPNADSYDRYPPGMGSGVHIEDLVRVHTRGANVEVSLLVVVVVVIVVVVVVVVVVAIATAAAIAAIAVVVVVVVVVIRPSCCS